MMWWSNIQKEKGAALYIVILTMVLVMGIVFGVGTIFLGQIKTLRGVGHSVVALYAAEAGFEKILYDYSQGVDIVDDCEDPGDCTGTLSNGATYDVVVDSPGGGCGGSLYCVESVGTFQSASRKLMIER